MTTKMGIDPERLERDDAGLLTADEQLIAAAQTVQGREEPQRLHERDLIVRKLRVVRCLSDRIRPDRFLVPHRASNGRYWHGACKRSRPRSAPLPPAWARRCAILPQSLARSIPSTAP